jgi:integration host factor subunit beta
LAESKKLNQEHEKPMTKSELIDRLANVQQHLAHMDVELGVKSILEQMSSSLSAGERIEIRGFGSFSLHHRAPRMGRNPKTGDAVALPGKHVPHFKPGKSLRDRVNTGN